MDADIHHRAPAGQGTLEHPVGAKPGESVVSTEHAQMVDLRRIEAKGDTIEATLYVSADSASGIADIIDAVRARIPGSEVAFIEQETGFDL